MFLLYSQAIGLTQSEEKQPLSPSQHDNQSSRSLCVPSTVAPRTAAKPRKVCDLLLFFYMNGKFLWRDFVWDCYQMKQTACTYIFSLARAFLVKISYEYTL